VTFAPPEGRELETWTRRALERHGVKADADALALLVDMVSADTMLLGNEIEKLALCCKDTGRVRLDDVASVLGRSRTIDAWALTNAIEDADPDAALAALRRLLEQRAAVPMLVGMIDWCLGRLFASEEPRTFPARQKALERRRDSLRGRGERAYALLREADRLVRTTGGDAEAALERAVLECAR
jgi:DNA polymerase III delta subunit